MEHFQINYVWLKFLLPSYAYCVQQIHNHDHHQSNSVIVKIACDSLRNIYRWVDDRTNKINCWRAQDMIHSI